MIARLQRASDLAEGLIALSDRIVGGAGKEADEHSAAVGLGIQTDHILNAIARLMILADEWAIPFDVDGFRFRITRELHERQRDDTRT